MEKKERNKDKSEVWAVNYTTSAGLIYAIALCYLMLGKCTVHWRKREGVSLKTKVRIPLGERVIERIRQEYPQEYLKEAKVEQA